MESATCPSSCSVVLRYLVSSAGAIHGEFPLRPTIADLARKTGLSARKISSELKALREDFHVLKREGGRKDGHWVIGDF